MPVITIEGPRVDVEKKRQLVKKVTETMVEVYGSPKESIIILIKENTPEHVGVGGELLADRRKK